MKARPPFLIVLAGVLLWAAVSGWEYVELRRLNDALSVIQARGEPASAGDLDTYQAADKEVTAAAYYRAAAALADGAALGARFGFQLNTARRSGEWPPDLVAEMRRIVESQRQALELADKGAQFRFAGFPPGTDYNYRWSELFAVGRLVALRTSLAALDGDSVKALASMHSNLKLRRAIGVLGSYPALFLADELSLIVNRTRPTAAGLAPVAEAFAEIDQDDLLRRDFVRLRATSRMNINSDRYALTVPDPVPFGLAEIVAGSLGRTLSRPFLLRRETEKITFYNAAIEASEQPWPRNLDALANLDPRTTPDGLPGGIRLARGRRAAWHLALTRCARLVVAIEQYRRANEERFPESWSALSPKYLATPLIDPYSGEPLKFARRDPGYVAYTVGSNRRDDGGKFDGLEIAAVKPTALESSPDFGILVGTNP